MPRTVWVISLLLAACAGAAAAMTVGTLVAWRHFGPAADLYRKLASAPHVQVERIIADVRGPLVFGGVVTLVTALLFAGLAFAVRRPRRRWVQITTWVATALGVALLVVDLNGGLTGTGSGSSLADSPRGLLGYDLAPDWYPILNAVLGVVTLALMVAGALALTRSDVLDYYRRASWQEDDRWSSFVSLQKDRQADGS